MTKSTPIDVEPSDFPVRPMRADQVFWVGSTFLFTALSVLKGFRWPGSWAATQAQIDYSEAFVKRGLFGSTATRVLHLNHYLRFAITSTLLLLLLFGVIYALAASSGVRRRAGTSIPMVVFAASYIVTYLAHLNGYMDILLAILAIAALSVRDARWRLIVSVPAVVVALLIHEMFLLTFLPVLLLSFVLQVWSERDRVRRSRVLAGMAVLGLMAGGITVGLARRAPLSTAATGATFLRVQAHTDFPLRPDAFAVLYVSGADNFRIASALVYDKGWWLRTGLCVLIYVPFVSFTLHLVYRIVKASGVSRQLWLFSCCAGAAMCPLLMNLLGVDMGRWYALAGLATFLVLCTTCRYLPGPPLRFSPGLERAGWVVVALGMASGGMLMDQKTVVPYPFFTLGIGHSLRLPVPSKL